MNSVFTLTIQAARILSVACNVIVGVVLEISIAEGSRFLDTKFQLIVLAIRRDLLFAQFSILHVSSNVLVLPARYTL